MQQATHEWWRRRNNYRLVTSTAVRAEAESGDDGFAAARVALIDQMEIVRPSVEAEQMAKSVVDGGLLPAKATADAGHIAVAIDTGVDALLSWNCTHIANPSILKQLPTKLSLDPARIPDILTPLQLLSRDSQ